jgi:hypothetical protein
MSLLPPPEAIYPDPEAAFTVVQAHAKDHGYAFKKRGQRASRLVFTCDRAGKYDPKGKDPAVHESKQRKATGSKMCGCLMSVELRLDQRGLICVVVRDVIGSGIGSRDQYRERLRSAG